MSKKVASRSSFKDSGKRGAVWTEDDDEEVEYGKWYDFDGSTFVTEDNKVRPDHQKKDVWPHWNEGRPTFVCGKLGSPVFYHHGVRHRYREYYAAVEFRWNAPRMLSAIRSNYGLLPRTVSREWSGVYRIFCPGRTIDRSCGKDPTGTLYVGRAGGEGKNWSILRTRIMAIVKREHHATNRWAVSDVLQQRFPWDSLAIEWAYTGTRTNYDGKPIPEARLAETWLLRSYDDSFGELPPWNQRA